MKKMLLLAVLVFGTYAFAEPQTWQIDPAHSAAQFSVRHLAISTVRGAFEKTSGTVVYDSTDLSKTSIDASIDTASVNTRIQMRDNDLKGPNFFDVTKFPTITFKSKKVESAGQGKLRVTGDLTIHGVTKEAVLEVDGPSAAIKDPYGNSRMGASASTKINRKDFGVNGASTAVGDEIEIVLDIEMIQPGAKK
ncbi:MAG TPA: YceI family protein [Terriglobales bacterium]|jgi:polyisoprenoid-binding protein YceI